MASLEHRVYQEVHNLSNEMLQQEILDHKVKDVSVELLIVFAVLYGLIAIGAIVGNILVIIVVATKKTMHTVTNTLVANLAVADVALGMFTIPFQFQAAILQTWTVAECMCKIAPFVKDVSVNVSVLSLTVIALDRYIAVIYPLKAGIQKRTALVVFISIWVLSIVSAIPEVLYFKIGMNYVSTDSHFVLKKICNVKFPSHRFMTFHSIFLALTQYIVPLTIITFSYVRITIRVWGRNLPGILDNEKNNTARRSSLRTANRRKVMKMLIVVVCLFAVCWLPLQTYNVLMPYFAMEINSFEYISIIWLCANWLAMSNACVNPFIYGLLNEKFKKEFKDLFQSCLRCCQKRRKFGVKYSHSAITLKPSLRSTLRTKF